MSRLDLHADGLLDRARLGQLGDEDRARLEAHCAQCTACRVELRWIEDGLHREPPSDEDRARGAAAVDALLGAHMPVRTKERGRIGFWKTAAAVSAGLLIASGAAALYSEVRALRERIAEVSAREGETSTEKKEGKRKRGRMAREKMEEQGPSPAPAPAPSPSPSPDAVPPPDARPILNPIPGPVLNSIPKPSPNANLNRIVKPDPILIPKAPSPARAADSLFARANAERDAGRFAAAAEHYFELSRLYPGSRSELAARVSRGQLLLHRLERPGDALEAFAGYVQALPRGALAEEARAGIALSLMRLGRTHEERTAWQHLLERHPNSLHAERARQRLASLPP